MTSPKNRIRTQREKVTQLPTQSAESVDIDDSIESDDIRELRAELAEMEQARQDKEDKLQANATRREAQINQARAQLTADLEAARNELSEDAGEIKRQRKIIQRAIEREKKRREEAKEMPPDVKMLEYDTEIALLSTNGDVPKGE